MDKYQNYKADDFLNDDKFVSWIKNPHSDDQNAAFWKNWVEENPTRQKEIENARLIYEAITSEPEIEETAQPRVWNKLQSSIIKIQNETEVKPAEKVKKLRWNNFSRIAASIALIISAIGFYFIISLSDNSENLVKLENNLQRAKTVLLSDGSSIILSPNSSLEYAQTFNQTNREVHLKGEAFFEISKNPQKPFVVYTAHLATRVVGTSFSISAGENSDKTSVSVVTGKVAVVTGNESSAILENFQSGELLGENEGIVFHEKGSALERFTFSKHPMGLLNFENAPILEVFNILEKNYGVDIKVDETKLESCSLNASLIDMPLQKKIDLICIAINYQYKIEGNIITLKGEGCPE
ncbi:FecR family protein [Flexithrix dorotheae]|uniref:FecR family protein n=1 Tax=Flexithrix dorotheae TaxID=70993 RepID=UPI0003799B7D|nr:FecR family protein [Flexithrix dorotheae]